MPEGHRSTPVRFIDCQPVWLDFETYYSTADGYTLKKMSNEAYIRDPRFEVMVLSYKRGACAPVQVVYGLSAITQVLHSIDWTRSVMVAHNAMFDATILAWRFGIHPAYLLCSMSMWRAQLGVRYRSSLAICAETLNLEAKGDAVARMDGLHLHDLTAYQLRDYVQYCGHDTELCFRLTMTLLPRFTIPELLNVHASLRMYTQAVLVLDRNVLLQAQHDERERRANIYTICAEHLGLSPTVANAAAVKKIVGSTDKFAQLLTALDVEVPMKQTMHKIKGTDKKQAVMIPAFAKTDAEFEALLESEDEMVADLCEARLLSKSTQSETRIDRLLGVSERGTLPFPIQYAGAAVTQRFGGAEKINLQNLKNGSPLRSAVCAPPGYKIVGGDLSQIELRMGWWVAGEQEKLDKFATGKHDPYKQSMVDTFGLDYGTMLKADRQVGKVIQLSCIAIGEKVLTDQGLVPIEKVTLTMRVWDGIEWVSHDGVVYQGDRKCITWDGLTATPDHEVYDDAGVKRRFDEIAPDPLPVTTTYPVYDILNAGPRHRFTVSGKLVSNCIYGTGWKKVKNTVRIQAKRTVSDDDAQKMVRVYRDDHVHVKAAWQEGQDALDAMLQKVPMHIWHNGVGRVLAPDDTLWTKHGAIERPSGLRLQYPNLQTRKGQWEDGRPKTEYIYIRQRERGGAPTVEFIYGSKVYQNFVQAMARDVIADAISAIVESLPTHWYLTAQIHDELHLVVPEEDAEKAAKYLEDILTRRPVWAPDLPLACETFIVDNYGSAK